MHLIGSLLKKHRHRIGLLYFTAGLITGLIVSPSISRRILVTHDGSLQSKTTQQQTPHQDLDRTPQRTYQSTDGWHIIHVFYGNASHLADNSAIPTEYFHSGIQWFSQLRQDQVIATLLRGKRKGYFVDLAANDPVRISNTYALENRFDWTGLCIEANPMYFAGLSYRNCHVVGAVIGEKNMEEVWFKFPNRAGPKGGIVGENFDNKQPSRFDEDRPRFTVKLLDVFRRFQTPKVIDYLSLDVEGAEDLIMSAFPFEVYTINLLTLERPSDRLKQLLEQNNYILLRKLKNWGETLWVHNSVVGKLDTVSAAKINTEDYKYREKREAPTKTDQQVGSGQIKRRQGQRNADADAEEVV